VTAGIAIISQLAPMAQEVTGASANAAAGLVGILSIANGLGRFLWASLSDAIGRRQVFLAMFPIQAVIFAVLPSVDNFALFAALTFIILLCYGGGFGTMPAFTADYFGAEHVGSIYGLMLTAWSFAGVFGPMLIATLREQSGRYDEALYAIAAVMFVSAFIPMMVTPPRQDDSI
jgi:OFA family oxalate/formate antiporter-like MFS transporter